MITEDLTHSGGLVNGAGAARLTVVEMEQAKVILLRHVQPQYFPQEVKNFQCSSRVILIALLLFKGNDGFLRVGGRSEKSDLHFNAKFTLSSFQRNIVLWTALSNMSMRKTGTWGFELFSLQFKKI